MLCLAVVQTFFVLCCAKNSAEIAVMSNVPNFEPLALLPEQHAVIRFYYLLKRNSDADVCNYERSVRWTDARSQHHFPLAPAVHAKAGSCIAEVEEWETSGSLYWDNSEYNRYDACGWWFLIAMIGSTRRYFTRYFTIHHEKDYSLSFLFCNFRTGIRLCLYTKRSYGRSICVIGLIFSLVI